MGCGSSQVGSSASNQNPKQVTPKAAVPDGHSAKQKSLIQRAAEEKQTRKSALVITQIQPNANVGEILKNVPLFAHLDKSEREILGGAMVEKVYENNASVFKEGDPGTHFYVVKSGNVAITKVDPDTGQELMLAQMGVDDYFGEQSLLTGEARHANVRAATGSRVVLLELHKQKFAALFQKDRIDVHFTQRRRVAVNAGNRDEAAKKDQRERGDRPTQAAMTDDQLKMVLSAVRKSLLFQNLEESHKEQVAKMMYLKDFAKDTQIITEGEDGNEFYIIESGEIDVFQRDKDGKEVLVDNHGPGGSFGELALMYDAPRNATCKAVEDCKMWVLERLDFNRIVEQLAKLRTQQYADWLARVEILKPLTRQERYDLAETMEMVEYDEGEVLFREGDPGDAMYLVVSGEVYFSVINKETSQDERIQGPHGTQRAGGYFGERALMNDAPRAASVTVSTLSRLLKIKRDVFEQMLGSLETLLKEKEKDYADNKKDRNSSDDGFVWKPLDLPFEQLETLGVLGKGSYGYVKLVRSRKDKKKRYALKAISKQRIVETHQKGHLFNEKNLMAKMNHPFITKLFKTYKDRDLLYFLLEPSLGGELFRILRKAKVFPYEQARFYAASVVLAFEYMHSKDYLYRDLKPENLLVAENGYLKVTDFGFCKKVPHKTWTMCGTPEYMCPEIIQTQGHGKGADWWTVGILIFEMLASHTPFVGPGGVMKMYDRICNGKFKYPSFFPKPAKHLISGLLSQKPALRFGVVKGGTELIKCHPWFKGLDWDALVSEKLEPPFVPDPDEVNSLANFNQRVTNEFAPYIDDGTGWDEDF